MKALTKTAIGLTCLSVAVLYATSSVTQALVTDGKKAFCIVSWDIPFYRTVRVPESAWWTFTRIWLVALSVPPILWAAVGVRTLVSRLRRPSSRLEVTQRG